MSMYYKAEFALMIGGNREVLESYRSKLNQHNNTETWNSDFFHKFKLIKIHDDLWIFTFCHRSYEHDECTWVEMRKEARMMELVIYENVLNYAEQEAKYEMNIYDDNGNISYSDSDEDNESSRMLDIMGGLITERLDFASQLKAVFEL